MVLATLSGCEPSAEQVVPRVTFLLDRSQSAVGGLAQGPCVAAFDRVVAFAADTFGTVTVESIDGNPMQDSGTPVDVNFSVLGPVADNPVLRNPMENRLKSTAKAQLLSTEASAPAAKGTDILAAFDLADRIIRRPVLGAQPEAEFLVICSDMMSTAAPLEFYRTNLTKDRIASLIQELQAAGRIPDWSGVTVYVVGAGSTSGSSIDADQVRGVQAFFTAYFRAAGANLVSYSATLPAFP
jgi:hypothetical protein